jgi:carbamoyl-phosphate synthase large subunit
MNILFTCAGRRNYLINYFKEALAGHGRICAADMQYSAPAMVDADEAFIVPSIYAEDYLEAIEKVIKENHIAAVISLNDLELPILARGRSQIENAGARLIVSQDEVIDIAFDKLRTKEFILSIGLKTPTTYAVFDHALLAIERGELQFPVVVKPRWGSASIGIDFPEDTEELQLSYRLQHKRVTRSILAKASSTDTERAILIQEKIEGKEYGMDVLNDLNGRYVGTFVREKLSMRAGETDRAMSVVDSRFDEIGRAISKGLKHIGNLDCDVLERDGQLYVLEMNPRFGGGYPFSHEAGVNTPAIYIDWLNGVQDIQKHIDYKAGVMFSKCDRLLKIDAHGR